MQSVNVALHLFTLTRSRANAMVFTINGGSCNLATQVLPLKPMQKYRLLGNALHFQSFDYFRYMGLNGKGLLHGPPVVFIPYFSSSFFEAYFIIQFGERLNESPDKRC